MKYFTCVCGQAVYFENSLCVACGRDLGFHPDRCEMVAIAPASGGERRVDDSGEAVRPCRNYEVEDVCNWLVVGDDPDPWCRACRLNEVIPDLDVPKHRLYWARLETAKRRALYTVLRLGLPIVGRDVDPRAGLAFAFLANREPANGLPSPSPGQPPHTTGHADGLITINVAEADAIERTRQRIQCEERYRTLLGHFRHELGHYYWLQRLANDPRVERFRALFGDERVDYAAALSRHYASGPRAEWEAHFVSPYASAHPWEDWAECWAHYMHIVDAVETAGSFGLIPEEPVLSAAPESFKRLVDTWIPLSIAQNAMNRSLGKSDAYPFVLGSEVIAKLHFVHEIALQPSSVT